MPIAFAKSKAEKPETKREPSSSTNALPVATSRLARDSGLSQQQYQFNVTDVQRIQNALRAAERGNVWLMNTLLRDMCATFPHLMSEWAKRKAVIVGQPITLMPADPESPTDKRACLLIREAIDHCRNWQDGLQHLLDATLYPISAAEKIFSPIGLAERGKFKHLKRYYLKEIAPISHMLECYEIPYQGFRSGLGKGNPATQFNADDWESWLRFYKTEPSGAIDYNISDVYAPEEYRHIIHRGILYPPSIPPNFGGVIRAMLFLNLFAMQDRDYWTLMMAKYGMAVPVAKVDSNNVQTMAVMRSALALGVQIGGIVIDKKAALEWSPPAGTDGSNSHKIYQDWVNSEVSKLVVGQTSSARPEKGGMAGGMAEQSEAVRDDLRTWDMMKLSDTLERQVFPQILEINGEAGNVKIFFGGSKPEQTKLMAATAQQMFSAGNRLTERGIRTFNERTGLEFERLPDEMLKTGGDKQTAGKPSRGKNSNDDGE